MKVLMVDDESIIRIGLKSIIDWGSEGFSEILEAGNGVEAYTIAVAEKPELIITDIKLPEMDGLELIRKLKEAHSASVIIVLSGYNDFSLVRKAMVLGAADYLLKVQLSEELLLETLNNLKNKIIESFISDSFGFARNLRYLQKKIIKDALLLAGETENILRDMWNALQINMDQNRCFLALIRYSYKDVVLSNSDQQRVFHTAVINTIQETLNDCFPYLCIEVDLNQLALLMQLPQNNVLPFEAFLPFGKLIHEMLRVYMNLHAEICFSPCMGSSMHCTWENLRAGVHLNVLSKDPQPVIDLTSLSLLPEPLEQSVPNYLNRFLAIHRMLDDPQYVSNAAEQIKMLYNSIASSDKNERVVFVLSFLSCLTLFCRKNPSVAVHFSYDPLEIKNLSDDELKKCFSEAVDEMLNLFKSTTQYPFPIRKAVQYIEEYYYTNITAKDVADHVELNGSYIGTLFKQHLGISPNNYIIRVRMNKAKQLLKETNFRVYEIAQMVGYENNYYFNRLFKKSVGLTPNEYRNLP